MGWAPSCGVKTLTEEKEVLSISTRRLRIYPEWRDRGADMETLEDTVKVSTPPLDYSYAATAQLNISPTVLRSGADLFLRVRIRGITGAPRLALINLKANELYSEVDIFAEEGVQTVDFFIDPLLGNPLPHFLIRNGYNKGAPSSLILESLKIFSIQLSVETKKV